MREFVSKARESTYLVQKMGSTINIGIIAFCVALWLAAILHVRRKIRKKETINLNILWILGAVFFLSGLGVQAMNMSKIYSNICCGPDTEEIAQKVKKALVYRYAFHGLTIASLGGWLVLRSIKKRYA